MRDPLRYEATETAEDLESAFDRKSEDQAPSDLIHVVSSNSPRANLSCSGVNGLTPDHTPTNGRFPHFATVENAPSVLTHRFHEHHHKLRKVRGITVCTNSAKCTYSRRDGHSKSEGTTSNATSRISREVVEGEASRYPASSGKAARRLSTRTETDTTDLTLPSGVIRSATRQTESRKPKHVPLTLSSPARTNSIPNTCGSRTDGERSFGIVITFTTLQLLARWMLLWPAAWTVHVLLWALVPPVASGNPVCEPIRLPMCRAMPYNMTRMPNLLHHSTQENARLASEQFEVLVQTQCSPFLPFYLCSMYVPICTVEVGLDAIPPCRSVCQKAKDSCEPLLNRFNVSWPRSLDCQHLPEYANSICVTPEAIVGQGQGTRILTGKKSKKKKRRCKCGKRTKLSRKEYMEKEFSYAIVVEVLYSEVIGELTLTKVRVLHALKQSTVSIRPQTEMLLWTNSSCACPVLQRQEYLLLGWEDASTNRLLYIKGSIATRWRKTYQKRIRRWEATLARQKRVQSQKKKKKKATPQSRRKGPSRQIGNGPVNPRQNKRKNNRKITTKKPTLELDLDLHAPGGDGLLSPEDIVPV